MLVDLEALAVGSDAFDVETLAADWTGLLRLLGRLEWGWLELGIGGGCLSASFAHDGLLHRSTSCPGHPRRTHPPPLRLLSCCTALRLHKQVHHVLPLRHITFRVEGVGESLLIVHQRPPAVE